jgi:hypothetical protein
VEHVSEGLERQLVSWVSYQGSIHNETVPSSGNFDFEFADISFLRAQVRNGTGSVLDLTNTIFFECL